MLWQQRLSVAAASVTNMVQRLATGSTPLVRYERHRGVLLSVAGKKRALEVVRHHRLIEAFLYEVLDYPIDQDMKKPRDSNISSQSDLRSALRPSSGIPR